MVHFSTGLDTALSAAVARASVLPTSFGTMHPGGGGGGGGLHHIGIGRAHKGRPIKLLVADRDIRVLDSRTGELIRRLTLDPSRDYQPIGGS